MTGETQRTVNAPRTSPTGPTASTSPPTCSGARRSPSAISAIVLYSVHRKKLKREAPEVGGLGVESRAASRR